MSSPTTKTKQKRNSLQRAPVSKPPFTIGDLKKVIPPHCFQRSLIPSFSYLAHDLILIFIFYYIATTYFHLLPSPYCYLAWPTYWIVQGCVCTGIWTLCHECGHHAFSDYQWVDDTVGFILHSALLTPYFSWKYSHRRHHSNTSSLEHDEVFVPRLKSELRWFSKYSNHPLGRILPLVVILTFGWPLYLAFNALGRHYDRFACHYDPYGPIYNEHERLWVYISDAGVMATSYVLYRVAWEQGLAWIVCIYGLPLLIGNGLLILVTFLNHTHPSVPHYDSSEWDWLRGALATVDRDYGVLNKVFHNGPNTHVLHHLFSSIPHYHAMEATKAIKPLLGEYYQFDATPFYKAIWRDFNQCQYVEKDEGSQDDKGLKKQDKDMSSDNKKNGVSFSKPPFTIGDIKKTIPPHCFQRSLVRSFSYLVQDLILVSIFYYIATTYFHPPFCYLAWPIYWIAQGCVLTGIWMIGHELGHQSFSDYPCIIDTIGLILHSALLTPYFSWKYTHRRHHSNTSSLEYDEVYVPRLKSQVTWLTKYLNKNPLGRVFGLATTLNLGWPLYLAFNASGRPYPRFASHYHPHGPSYYDRERLQIYISDAGVIATTYVLYRIALVKGLTWLVCIYGVPLQIMNIFIVLITLLNHTHSSVPHYGSSEWDWLRGALATVDRDFGVLNKVFHHIPDAHVLHHLFSTIPHYHALEATRAIKPLLGEYYQFDSTPFYKAIWRDYKECIYVEKDATSKDRGIFWYKNETN